MIYSYIMESFVQQILIKFETIKKILHKIINTFNEGYDLLNDFDDIETNFSIFIGPGYLLLYSNESNKLQIQNDVSNYLLLEDYSIKLNKLTNKIIILLKNNNIDINELLLQKIKNKRKKITIDLQYLFSIFPWDVSIKKPIQSTLNYNKCSLCANNMLIDTNRSELYCENCGMVRELIGTVFDDTQFYNQEGQKAKSGTFNPNRHFQFWWSHILAKEPEEELGDKKDPENLYGEKTLKHIKTIITRDHKILQLLTVNDIRMILREIEKTDLNKNVPLILKKITGVGPPYIPDHVTLRVENLFTKAIEIGEHIKQNRRINRHYYPSYIYRIIEAITTEKDTELRRVLYYIYIQSKETVELDDQEWERICVELKEIQYKPTDRTLGQKYVSF